MVDEPAPAGLAGRWLAAVLVAPVLRWLVVVHSVPGGQPWRDRCPECGAPPSPVASPSGRCTGCGRRQGAPPWLVEVATVVAAALVVVTAIAGRWPVAAIVALTGWAAVAVALTFVDLAVHRLPDRLTLPAAAWVLGWLAVAAAGGDGAAWLRALTAAAGCGLGFALISLVLGARGYGLGDAKLAVSTGALLGWLGWGAVLAGLFLAFLASAVVALGLLLARRVRWRDSLPFGPFLVGGTFAAVVWASLSGEVPVATA